MATGTTARGPSATQAGHTDGSDDAGRPAVETRNLALRYSDGTEAVSDLSLTVPRGECFGFLGANGAGKTTTIEVLATLLSPTAGTAMVTGLDVTERRRAIRAAIGYMPQSTSVDEELSARENLQFACAAYGVPRAERSQRIATLLDLVDLADVAENPAGTYSGGMQKRLDAATALVHEPDVVFLDEPTTGLDPAARNRLWEYVRQINHEGTTVFLTTQYLEEADALCDRVAVLDDGEVVVDGPPERLKERVGGDVLEIDVDADGRPADAGTVVREAGALPADATVDVTDGNVRITTASARACGPDLLVALRDAEIAVAGFDVQEPTLDDVFLAITDGESPADGESPTVEHAGGNGSGSL